MTLLLVRVLLLLEVVEEGEVEEIVGLVWWVLVIYWVQVFSGEVL